MANAIQDWVQRESGRFIDWGVRERVFPGSPLLNLIPRTTWPEGMGEDLSVIAYEASAPTGQEADWSRVTTIDGQEGGSCLPTVERIGTGSTVRSFYLYRKAVEGPDFCAVDLHSAGHLQAQLDAIVRQMAQNIKIRWELHDKDEYFKLCGTKVIVDGCPPSADEDSVATTWTAAATAAGATCPTAQLSQGVLDRFKLQLIRDGAYRTAMGFDDGSPTLTLITSPETSDEIIRLGTANREDLHWGAPSVLLAPYGVQRSWKGFYHLKDHFSRRFACNAGTYTFVSPWTLTGATKGTKAVINSTWKTTLYEESFIFDRGVMTQYIPRPITNPAAGFNFDPVNYLGEFKTMNILDRVNNPDGTILYHRAIMAAASKPENPELGVAFIHLRCDPACNLVTVCTT
jgi:hypothetical protein